MVDRRLLELKEEMETEAQNLLGFWEKYAFSDDDNIVFHGAVDANLTPDLQANKHIVLTARLVWTFSYAYRLFGEMRYKEIAQRMYEYLVSHFIDREYGGVFWEVKADGTPHDTNKRTYGESFAIYALSEYYRTFGEQKALDEAIAIYECLEAHAYDKEHKGYYEALTRDWKYEQKEQVSNVNPYSSACKTMNTHLHLLEAYTSLYRVWKDPGLKDSLVEQIEVMIEKIVNQNNWHYMLYFDRAWNSITPDISYGHDIEGSWLLWEAAECVGDEKLKEYVKPVSMKMAEAIYEEGWHDDGGIIYEYNPLNGKVLDFRSWWVQAEAVVGFFNAWQLTGDSKYLDAAERVWEFTKKEVIDHENGGWFSFAVSDGRPTKRIDGWTCPYHNARMCYKIMERIQHQI